MLSPGPSPKFSGRSQMKFSGSRDRREPGPMFSRPGFSGFRAFCTISRFEKSGEDPPPIRLETDQPMKELEEFEEIEEFDEEIRPKTHSSWFRWRNLRRSTG
ncbi:hypothetical protein RchiOBHm_Chr7g0242661 [Rosa chinensis]|uniref:Uncharacterized protein n=1 Tax=Rosa chinensis TaxID=74649 RepID=A0A2P6PIJ0_ROSCH|nr:hypothetical protein RchiOBHm_Chr7g0242661 [Rosa chinensis]